MIWSATIVSVQTGVELFPSQPSCPSRLTAIRMIPTHRAQPAPPVSPRPTRNSTMPMIIASQPQVVVLKMINPCGVNA
jgi:hypothetical protein